MNGGITIHAKQEYCFKHTSKGKLLKIIEINLEKIGRKI